MIKNVYCSSCQKLLKLEFSRQNFEYSESSFMKIRPVEAELFHTEGQTDRRTDGRTDMTEETVGFCNFTNGPKNNGSIFIDCVITCLF
jgi:hypothetical protein